MDEPRREEYVAKWPFLDATGLSIDQLQNGLNSCPHEINPILLCNGTVHELSKMNLKWSTVTCMLEIWMGTRFPPNCDYRKVQACVGKLFKERLSLIKKKKTPENVKLMKDLLEEPFTIPLHGEVPQMQSYTCVDRLENMEKELHAKQKDNQKLNNKSIRIQKDRRNSNIREKRKAITIAKQAHTLHQQTKNIKKLNKALVRMREQRRARFHTTMKSRRTGPLIRISTERGTQTDLDETCHQCERYEAHIEKLTSHSDKGPRRSLTVFHPQQYTEEMTKCVLQLLQHNVGYSHIAPVIQAVLDLANLEANQLPCRATVDRIAKLRLPLVHLNLGATMTTERNTTLYSDETKKRGQQFETYVVTTTAQEPKILGLRELVDKSASTTLATLTEIVQDLDHVNSCSRAGSEIIANIKNTMSDRAATEKAFHQLFRKYRNGILPEVIPNWAKMSADERTKVGEIHNFFCGLHLLVNAAEKADASLSSFENKYKETHDDDSSYHFGNNSLPSSSYTVDLVRTACKAFSRGGDEKSGCFSSVSVFLCARGEEKSLTKFRGNRFNIVFHNAAILYHQRHLLRDFLQNCYGADNRLLQTILHYLGIPVLVAGCRAMGLLNKYFTKPLWNLLERNGNILEMNTKYQEIIHNLKNCNTQLLLQGEVELIPDSQPIPPSDILTSLTTASDDDLLTTSILNILLPDIAAIFEHLLQDQLPGGDNYSKNPDTHPECSSTLKHNKIPETVFAQLDYLETTKPSATALTVESHILFNFNKVGRWLDGLTEEEFSQKILKASLLRNITTEQFRARHQQMKQAKLAALKEKQKELERKRQKVILEKVHMTNDMIYHGLWQTLGQVDYNISLYKTTKEKTEAVKAQLRFRKQVLQQHIDEPKLFAFSHNKKQITVGELLANLKSIVAQAESTPEEAVSHLVQKRVMHTFEVDDANVEYV